MINMEQKRVLLRDTVNSSMKRNSIPMISSGCSLALGSLTSRGGMCTGDQDNNTFINIRGDMHIMMEKGDKSTLIQEWRYSLNSLLYYFYWRWVWWLPCWVLDQVLRTWLHTVILSIRVMLIQSKSFPTASNKPIMLENGLREIFAMIILGNIKYRLYLC